MKVQKKPTSKAGTTNKQKVQKSIGTPGDVPTSTSSKRQATLKTILGQLNLTLEKHIPKAKVTKNKKVQKPKKSKTTRKKPAQRETPGDVPTSTWAKKQTRQAVLCFRPLPFKKHEKLLNAYISLSPSDDEEIPWSATDDEEIPWSATDDEEIPWSVTDDEEIPWSLTDDDEIPWSVTDDEEIPWSLTDDDEIPWSATDDEEIPWSVTDDEEIRGSVTDDEEIPRSLTDDEDESLKVGRNQDEDYNETLPGKPVDLPIGTDSRNAIIADAILAGKVVDLEGDDDEESDMDKDSDKDDLDTDSDTALDDALDDDEDDDKDNIIHPSFEVTSTAVVRHIAPIVNGLIEHARSKNFGEVLRRETAWHPTTWSHTVRNITSAGIISEVQTSLTAGMKKVLSQEYISIPLLAQLLPEYDNYIPLDSALIYAFIGCHKDGRWALYIGSTTNPRQRRASHMSRIRAVKRGDLRRAQLVHQVLGQPGWNIRHKVLCEMGKTISAPSLLWIETVIILLTRSLQLTIGKNSSSYVLDLAGILEPPAPVDAGYASPLALSDPGTSVLPPAPGDAGVYRLRLNRCLPIHLKFPSLPSPERAKPDTQAAIKRKRSDRCDSCGITRAEGAKVFFRKKLGMALCSREFAYWRKHGVLTPQPILWPMADHCESCGETGKLCRHPHLPLTICAREDTYYRKHGVLSPVRRHPYPLADHCESCGSKKDGLRRHPNPKIRMTLCFRELSWYKEHGTLHPIRIRRKPQKRQNPLQQR